MKLLIGFLFATFLLGGVQGARWSYIRRPHVFVAVCTVVGAMFYSLRVL